MDVVVTGIGLNCCLGSRQTSWQHLLAGESGLKWHQPFLELSPRLLGMIDKQPIPLSVLTQQVVASALQDAGLVTPLPDCGVVIGSSRSCQGVWEQLAFKMSRERREPNLPYSMVKEGEIELENWLDTLLYQASVTAAREVGTKGPVLAPMAACSTGIWAIAQGYELIQTGQCERVIVGAIEAPITRLTLTAFGQMGVLAKTGYYPFDKHREGLIPGEGGAVLVLESAELARSRGASIYGKVLGFSMTCDAENVTSPSQNRYSAIAAVKQCLERSHLNPSDIDYIHAHGSGTLINDQNEAELIQYLFPKGVPVSGTKGATGHTLGACAAIGAAFCLMSLKDQKLPPCVGLKESEFDIDLLTSPRQGLIQRVLCFSFGFGGQNAVVAFGNYAEG